VSQGFASAAFVEVLSGKGSRLRDILSPGRRADRDGRLRGFFAASGLLSSRFFCRAHSTFAHAAAVT